ncbi:hypothetical protein RAC89_23860 [Paenibacillus sp. GD4]|uniref:hypothetical protein n=1 Tax=Paenibacillus sp. GD4 TaxID=3068890 RepID=UPI002796B083|nr:hypothetical protein [Paenibacillus sp. GD4]
MKKLFPGLFFVLGVIVLYYGVRIVSGMIVTMYYVPNIINSYASVDSLQSKTSFGVQLGSYGRAVEALLVAAAGLGLYVAGKWLLRKRG